MKAYVFKYKVNPLDSQIIEFEFARQPSGESSCKTRELAEVECRKLNQFGVHVGEHVCSFAVDTLPGGEFGIICVCHPMHQPGPATAVLQKGPARALSIASDESKRA